jgi:hypothetical protein
MAKNKVFEEEETLLIFVPSLSLQGPVLWV